MEEAISDFEIDQKVEKYAEGIMEMIREHAPEMEIRSSADSITSDDGSLRAQRVYIKTDFGVVVVLPDFINRSASACTINIGMVKGMSMEGFTDEQIDQEGRIFSKPVPFTKSGIEVLSYYLTHKLFTNP